MILWLLIYGSKLQIEEGMHELKWLLIEGKLVIKLEWVIDDKNKEVLRIHIVLGLN